MGKHISDLQPLSPISRMGITLDSLPFDVKALILEHIGLHLDLSSLIRASPVFYHEYICRPAHYLRASIAAEFPGALLQDLLAVHYAKSKFPPIYESENVLPQIEAFLEDYFSPAKNFQLPTSQEELYSILRLAGKVRYFAGKYALYAVREGNALRKFHNRPFKFDACNTINVVRLSDSERFRIYRGLLRFELLSTVFRTPRRAEEKCGWNWWPGIIDKHFLSKFQGWEREEIFCIRFYFQLLLSEVMLDADRKLKAAIRSVELDVTRSDETASPDPPISALKPFQAFDVVELSFNVSSKLGIFFQSEKSRWEPCIERIASFGLGYMFPFSLRYRRTQFKMLRNPYFWTRGFHSYYADITEFHEVRHFSDVDPTWANAGFLLYHSALYSPLTNRMVERAAFALRAIGLVFWDLDRISCPAFFGAVSAALQRCYWRRYQPFDTFWARPPRCWWPQQPPGIKGARLQYAHVRLLEREFGLYEKR